MAYVNRIGYGKNLGGLGNPQPSPKVYRHIFLCIYTMDAVQRLDVGGPHKFFLFDFFCLA